MPSLVTRHSIIASFLFSTLISQNSFAEENDHCTTTEKTFFSCVTKSKKILSLCGIEKNKSIEKLAYRYGKIGKIELDFSPPRPLERFTYNHYARYRTDYLTINFHNRNFKYSIYQNHQEEQTPETTHGVIVSKDTEEFNETNISCMVKTNKIRHLSTLLPCDKNEALGCYTQQTNAEGK